MTTRRALWALIGTATLARLAWAASLGGMANEAYYYMYAQHLDWSYFDHPPMVGLVSAAGLRLVGGVAPVLGLRLGFVALMAGSTWLMARIASRAFGDRAGLLAKIEKPQAIERLDEILKLSDAVMVARGDLGVELPPESVPPLQNRIVARARQLGKPVVVATQMLESMIVSPTPTRAEVSDVATAIYDGADAVMLSAESAAGQYPVESVAMMDRIGRTVELDPVYAARIHFTETLPEETAADALADASRTIATNLKTGPMVCYTSSGSTARRIARERPPVKILAMTASLEVARRLGLQWGVHAVHTRDVASFEEMVAKAKRMALRHGLAKAGERLVILAGVPFKTAGSTNVLHVVRLAGDELDNYLSE